MSIQIQPNNPSGLSDEEINEQKKKQMAVEEYLLRNAEALRQWMKSHPNQKPPVYYDDDLGKPVWVNRKQRRNMLKKQNKTRMIKPKKDTELQE